METIDRKHSVPLATDKSAPVILHVGTNLELLTIRSSVLERTGFPVRQANSLAEVQEFLGAYPRGLMVLCHTLSTTQRANLLEVLCKQSGIDGLLVTKDRKVPAGKASCVETISTSEGPHALVVRAKRMLSAL